MSKERSHSKNDSDFSVEDERVCNISFFYDGITNQPKFRVERDSLDRMDPLTIYAIACVNLISENESTLLEEMNDCLEEIQNTYIH